MLLGVITNMRHLLIMCVEPLPAVSTIMQPVQGILKIDNT